MSQNITLLGASYSDVPSVLLPKTGGGTAQFDDTTDANATASDIATQQIHWALVRTSQIGQLKQIITCITMELILTTERQPGTIYLRIPFIIGLRLVKED